MVGSHLLICEHNNIQYVGESAKTTKYDGEASMIWKVKASDSAKVTNKVTFFNLVFNLLRKFLCSNTTCILTKLFNIQDVFLSQILKNKNEI